MTFSSRVKSQIAHCGPQAECCMKAEAYGLLLFSRLLCVDDYAYKTEHKAAAERLAQVTASYCGVFVEIKESPRAGGHTVYSVSIPGESQKTAAMAIFGLKEAPEAIDRSNIAQPCCTEAFLRGAFLAAGTVSDPNKAYHLEISGASDKICADLAALLCENGIKCGTTVRRKVSSVYIKDSESIEDFIALLGAGAAYYDFVNIRIIREFRNTANRRTNCDEANIAKTVSAATKQISAIKKLKACGGLNELPDELRELAQLRLDNPEMTLRELGENLSTPMSRSGVNHRLQKLMELAGEE